MGTVTPEVVSKGGLPYGPPPLRRVNACVVVLPRNNPHIADQTTAQGVDCTDGSQGCRPGPLPTAGQANTDIVLH